MATKDIYYHVGDTSPDLALTLTRNGVPVTDLATAVLVTCTIKTLITARPMTVSGPVVSMIWLGSDLSVKGIYQGFVTVTYPGNRIETFPAGKADSSGVNSPAFFNLIVN